MAKSDTPAEALSPARPPRPAPKLSGAGAGAPDRLGAGFAADVLTEEPLRPGVAKARAGVRPAGSQAPVIHSGAGAFIDGEMLDALEEIEAFEDVDDDDDDPERNDPTAPMGEAIAALNARDYFAEGQFAGGRRSEGLGAVGYDTAGRALAGRDAAHDVDFGAPRLRAAAKLPIANLEMPSGERLDLTPSPVPRVALAPATGSVDISLVPGPHASRNLPTLAAHHLLGAGRRQQQQQRRPAAAVTVPPPGRTNSHLDLPLPRRSGALARDVRSSKREIVLGLAIGLGLSMMLAGLGQAYLKSGVQDVIAAVPPQPAQLESLTLAARPQTLPSAAVPPSAVPPSAVPLAAVPLATAVPHAATAEKRTAEALLASNTSASTAREAGTAGRATVASRAVPARASGSKRNVEPRTPRRASNARVLAAASTRGEDGAASAEPPAFEAGKSSEESPPPPRSPLSPAESAGLGLDLPL